MSPQKGLLCHPPSRVLLATDLSDLKQILPITIEFVAKFHAEMRFVHVLPDVKTPETDSSLPVHADHAAAQHYAEKVLKDAMKAATKARVKCSLTMRTGHVVEAIRQIVQEWNPDRVVVGSHGVQKYQQNILGSVAEAIFREIETPVLAIGPAAARDQWLSRKPPRFLYATALDRDSRVITQSVLECAKFHRADLTMLHVIPEIVRAHPSALRVRSCAERLFQEILSSIPTEGVHPSCMIERGQTVERIHRVARDGRFDLIILGAVLGSSFRQDIVPGTAYGVICGAPCPVLVLKAAPQAGITTLPAAS